MLDLSLVSFDILFFSLLSEDDDIIESKEEVSESLLLLIMFNILDPIVFSSEFDFSIFLSEVLSGICNKSEDFDVLVSDDLLDFCSVNTNYKNKLRTSFIDNLDGHINIKIECKFNRVVIFDTTMNSWHGLPDPVVCPENKSRNSLATYYLCEPSSTASERSKVLYAPTEDQKNNPEILDLINKRASVF